LAVSGGGPVGGGGEGIGVGVVVEGPAFDQVEQSIGA
jgi:hypothetical protein